MEDLHVCRDLLVCREFYFWGHGIYVSFSNFDLFVSERLEKELRELLPLYLSTGIRVIPPPYGVDSAWHGARLISNVSFHKWLIHGFFRTISSLIIDVSYSFSMEAKSYSSLVLNHNEL